MMSEFNVRKGVNILHLRNGTALLSIRPVEQPISSCKVEVSPLSHMEVLRTAVASGSQVAVACIIMPPECLFLPGKDLVFLESGIYHVPLNSIASELVQNDIAMYERNGLWVSVATIQPEAPFFSNEAVDAGILVIPWILVSKDSESAFYGI